MQTRQESAESTVRQRICTKCAYVFYTVELDLPPNTTKWHHNIIQRIAGYQRVKFY